MNKVNCQSHSAARTGAVLLTGLMLSWAGPTASYAADVPATQAATAAPGQAEAGHSSLIARGLDETGGKITLTAGQSRLIRAALPVQTVDLTQPDVVTVKVVSPTDIVLTGRKPGTTQLVLWDDKGRSQSTEIVVSADLSALASALTKLLPDTKIELSEANGAVVLSGRVASEQVAEQVTQIAAPYAGQGKVVNLLKIAGGQQVTLQVRFAEVSKTVTNALGVNFGIASGPNQFGANVIGQVGPLGITNMTGSVIPVLGVTNPGSNVTNFGSFVAGRTPFEVFVTALRQNNLLRVLAEPNLTVMSGKEATFLAGGEYPYPVPQSNGSGGTTITIEYKPYGVRLNFTPVVLGDGRIRLHVAPEVSDLDYSNGITLNGFVVPGVTKRTADTTVELAEGQTLALAGLLNSRVTANNSSTPILGDLPILGALFRSVRYERDETELVVLVTPTLASGMNPEQVPAVTGERWRYPSAGEVFWLADMGGPAVEKSHAPPKRFQGAYGFTPAGPTVADAGK